MDLLFLRGQEPKNHDASFDFWSEALCTTTKSSIKFQLLKKMKPFNYMKQSLDFVRHPIVPNIRQFGRLLPFQAFWECQYL